MIEALFTVVAEMVEEYIKSDDSEDRTKKSEPVEDDSGLFRLLSEDQDEIKFLVAGIDPKEVKVNCAQYTVSVNVGDHTIVVNKKNEPITANISNGVLTITVEGDSPSVEVDVTVG